MGTTEPIRRIKFAEKEVERYRDDVEGWKKLHDDLKVDCWIWEDLIAKANFIFLRYLKLDQDIQQAILTSEIEFSEETEQEMWTLMRDWLDISRKLIPQVNRLKESYGSVDGSEELFRNIKAQANAEPNYRNDTHATNIREQRNAGVTRVGNHRYTDNVACGKRRRPCR